MNLNMFFFNLSWIWSKKTSVSSFYKKNNFKPCLTKQLLNMFKLWCERGIRSIDLIPIHCCRSELAWNSSPIGKKGQLLGPRLNSWTSLFNARMAELWCAVWSCVLSFVSLVGEYEGEWQFSAVYIATQLTLLLSFQFSFINVSL